MVLVAAEMLIYPVLILLVGGFILLTVPRDHLRTLLPYGVVLGGLVDFLECVVTGTLGITSFKNLWIFHAGGHPLLGHVAWAFIVVFYLYFWPKGNRYLGYLYALAFALLATGFSQVVSQAELFDYAPWFYPLPMFAIFLARFALATWAAKRWGALD
jgi:hypothetical protein